MGILIVGIFVVQSRPSTKPKMKYVAMCCGDYSRSYVMHNRYCVHLIRFSRVYVYFFWDTQTHQLHGVATVQDTFMHTLAHIQPHTERETHTL